MIKTILFDFGGVISESNRSWDSMHKRIKEVSGLTNEELDEIFHTHWEDISVNKKSFTHFLQDLVVHSKNNLTVEKLEQLYAQDVTINNDVVEIIKNLKKKGYRVVIFANDSKFGEEIRLKKVEKYVDTIYSSATLQLRKPNPAIYKRVLQLENIHPEEALFIDDKERNTVVAERLGIKSIIFKNTVQLQNDLQKLLL
jgi:putative hydrolase of the HAD superfamily